MKKSLVALAVLAASGASFAQSTVTLYGLADVWVGTVKSEMGTTQIAPAVAAIATANAIPAATNFFGNQGLAGSSLTNTKLDSGGVNQSRWGIKGSEDLGGGLKANFLLEQGFAIDTGAATAGQAFSRQSYVGFSGGFGEVKLGKVWTAYDDVSGASDAVFDSALAPMNHVFRSTGYNGNPSNTIYYVSPTFNGFSGAFSYSLGENKGTAAAATATLDGRTADATAITSLNLAYAAGPLAVHLGYQVEGTNVVPAGTLATAPDQKFTRLGGSYDFGVATAKLTYGKVSSYNNGSGDDATEYQIGVDVPVSTALTVSASYAKSDDDHSTVGAFKQSRSGYGIAAAYTLSKRTFLYGGFNTNKATNLNAGDDKLDILAVGVQHKF